MAKTREIRDPHGVVHQANRILRDKKLKLGLLDALAELEDEECFARKSFPKTRLHKVTGVKESVFRADVDQKTGWRLHVQHAPDGTHILLNDILESRVHDHAARMIKTRKHRYVTPS
jgi:hypothetical protein